MKLLYKDKAAKIIKLSRILYNSNDLDTSYNIVKEIASYVDDYPICKECGRLLVYRKMSFSVIEDEVIITTPKKMTQTFEDYQFHVCRCEYCVRYKFKDNMPSMQRYMFMLKTAWAKYIYDIPENLHYTINSSKCAVTLNSLIRKYGDAEGKRRYDKYVKVQAYKNTFEYKSKVYNWNREQFDLFNKSRAITLKNLISKYGEENGRKAYDSYVKKQSLTKSFDYMCSKFGKEKAIEINKSKSNQTRIKSYSDISQECFIKIDKILENKYVTYFATKNQEKCFYLDSINRFAFLDYFIEELNVCIEFNGTIYHGDPRIFEAKSYPNPYNTKITAEQIWENDKSRKEALLKQYNIKTYYIWENDYKDQNFDLHKFVKIIIDENS